MATTFRAFIAIDIVPTAEMVRFHEDLAKVGPGLKPVDLSAVHVTLKFLGDTEESLVPQIEQAMVKSTAGIAPFTLALSKAGAFPKRPPIRVVWVGLKGAEPLTMMAEVLEEEMSKLGFTKEERPFSPHLTMARVKDPRASFASEKAVERYREVEFGTQPVTSVKLKRSVLSRSGPEYSTVVEVELH